MGIHVGQKRKLLKAIQPMTHANSQMQITKNVCSMILSYHGLEKTKENFVSNMKINLYYYYYYVLLKLWI